MITKRIVANLVVFFLVSAALVTYGAVTLLGNPLERGPRISTTMADASGVLPGFSASYDGVIVGQVADTELEGDQVRITVELDPGVQVPGDVEASVVRASAVGEQRLELRPTDGGTAPPLADGDEVPAAADPAPPEVGEVVETVSGFMEGIPADDLNTVIHESAITLDGREADLRELTRDLDQLSVELLEHEDSFRSLLDDAPPVLDSVASVGPELQEALEDTATLTDVLAERRYDLVALMQHGGDLSVAADQLLDGIDADLSCLLDDAASLTTFVGDPENLANIEAALGLNTAFFGPIDSLAVRGHAEDVGYGAPERDDQLWLRVLTIMPPGTPPAVAYHPPRPTPPTLPGEGCPTSPYGPGVGPASQADAAEPAIGGRVIWPSGSADAPQADQPAPPSEPEGSDGGSELVSGSDPTTYNPVAAMAAARHQQG